MFCSCRMQIQNIFKLDAVGAKNTLAAGIAIYSLRSTHSYFIDKCQILKSIIISYRNLLVFIFFAIYICVLRSFTTT